MSGKAELFIWYSSVNIGCCLLNLLDVIWFASSLNSSLKRKVNLFHQGFFLSKTKKYAYSLAKNLQTASFLNPLLPKHRHAYSPYTALYKFP